MSEFKFSFSLVVVALGASLVGGCMHRQSRAIDMHYPTDYRQRHPIMVSPSQAYVPHQCGQWPGDLGASDIIMDAHNKPYWNYGCATQKNLALMVANPSDLLGPARETPANTQRRIFDIDQHSRGQTIGTQQQTQQSTSLMGTGR